jgi:hypothetical protein
MVAKAVHISKDTIQGTLSLRSRVKVRLEISILQPKVKQASQTITSLSSQIAVIRIMLSYLLVVIMISLKMISKYKVEETGTLMLFRSKKISNPHQKLEKKLKDKPKIKTSLLRAKMRVEW